jgi:formylglycine-generating enzyme required for sulfatase activity
LTPKAGYTLTGVAANTFTVAGASATNAVNSGVVTAVFPITPSYVSATIGNMMAVPGGTFNNGTANMTVSSFRMSQHEITGEQYAVVMGVADPSYFASVTNNPVERITWYDAVEFCNTLSTRENLTPVYTITNRTPVTGYPITSATVSVSDWSANGYRLPTEAEWQFAARGGNSSNGYTYAGSHTIGDVAWYTSNSGSTTHTVGGKTANELGLYDMSGNVWEWCWDWYGNYPTTAQTDYRGAATGAARVIRGGSWHIDAAYCAVADRDYYFPGDQSNALGFRVVRP